jgi:hypothetical protein
MNSLKEDLLQPLDKVQRWWIRKPAMLICLIPLLFVNMAMIVPITIWFWFKETWNPINLHNKGK